MLRKNFKAPNGMHQSMPKAVILAAGRGRRLMPHTAELPKCLVEIGGKPILHYQLASLEKAGVRDICIVTGYRAPQIMEYVGGHFPHLNVSFIHNDRYENTNDIYSFVLAEGFCRSDFIHLDSDVLFHPTVLSKLIDTPLDAHATCVRTAQCGEEEMKVIVDERGMVRKMGKWIDPALASGECMGISLFRAGISAELFQKAHTLGAESGWSAYCNDAMNAVMDSSNHAFYSVDITEFPAMEIDFPEDLRTAERYVLPQIKAELFA